jgi:hypothetical protein
MPSLTIHTKFAFGDRVRFESQMQRCSGEGTVFGVIFDRYGELGYIIEIERDGYTDLQPGILESEMALMEAAS